MATKTWNGSDAAFTTDADWGPFGTPVPGDVAVINAGTVTVTGTLAPALAIQLNAGAATSPTLALTSATIQRGDSITDTSANSTATLSFTGANVNAGNITLSGNANPVLTLASDSGTSLTNQGGISILGTGGNIQAFGAGSIVNNGVISMRATAGAVQSDNFFGSISGTGAIRLNGPVGAFLNGPVGAGQTVTFETGGIGVAMNAMPAFAGTFAGFNNGDYLSGISTRWSNVAFAANSSNTGGSLNFSLAGGVPVASVAFTGAYTSLADFTVTQDAGTGPQSTTVIATSVAATPTRVFVNDQTTGVISQEAATPYSGPVSFLQYQYISFSPDNLVLAARVPNVFLHGGAGDDALQAFAGSNVLDGGGGSNFLIGATGADGGKDTFYVDERGGSVTWSTLVNFHVGDQATIFGFKQGVSTLPIVASDGAAGYTGVTIHSEIGGAGTGVNGSVTFAGVSLSDFNTKFNLGYGNVGGADYLIVTRLAA